MPVDQFGLGRMQPMAKRKQKRSKKKTKSARISTSSTGMFKNPTKKGMFDW